MNPLQLNNRIHKIEDFIAIYKSEDQKVCCCILKYDKTVLGKNESVLDIEFSSIICFKTITDIRSSIQNVLLVTQAGLYVIGEGAAGITSIFYTLDTTHIIEVIGIEPVDGTSVLFLCLNDGAYYIDRISLNIPGESNHRPAHPQASSTTVINKYDLALDSAVNIDKVMLMRYNTEAYISLTCIEKNQIVSYVYKLSDLLNNNPSETPTKVFIDNTDATKPINYDVGNVLPGSEQLFITYTNGSGALSLAVVYGHKKKDSFSLDFSSKSYLIETSLAAPVTSDVKVAIADLLDETEALEQIILAYNADYQGISGVVCVMLFDFSLANGLLLIGENAYCGIETGAGDTSAIPAKIPFCSIDLKLGAGLFGVNGQRGIFLVGVTSSLADLMSGKATILSAILPIDATRPGLPNTDTEQLSTLPYRLSNQVKVDDVPSDTVEIIGLSADLSGLSVYLGVPTESEKTGIQQIFAIIQAIPFQYGKITSSEPQLSLSTIKAHTNNVALNSFKAWTMSEATSAKAGIPMANVHKSFDQTYGQSFDKMDDSMTTCQMTLDHSITTEDLILVMGLSYTVWEYPLIAALDRTTAIQDRETIGHALVVFPTSTMQQSYIVSTDYTFGYTPKYEIGKLLSYVGLPKMGLGNGGASDTIFDLVSFDISTDQGAPSIEITNRDIMSTETATQANNIDQSTESTLDLAGTLDLFSFLPTSFGLDMRTSGTYTDNSISTNSTTNTTMLNLSFSMPNVASDDAMYSITPYIYIHNKIGCIMVAYDVVTKGIYWNAGNDHHSTGNRYVGEGIVLFRVYRNDKDIFLSRYSQNISVIDAAADKKCINITYFNDCLDEQQATLNVYKGKPTLAIDNKSLQAPAVTGNFKTSWPLDNVKPCTRPNVPVSIPAEQIGGIAYGDYITVEVVSNGQSSIYWTMYIDPKNAVLVVP